MKITKILTFITCLIVSNAFSQTTQEEYNYITKGYAIQLDSGLDMKKGYTFSDLSSTSITSGLEKRNTEFKGLIKDGQTKPCAVMMIYKRADLATEPRIYICIPSIDAPREIWQQTLAAIQLNFQNNDIVLQTVIWGLMKLASQEVGN